MKISTQIPNNKIFRIFSSCFAIFIIGCVVIGLFRGILYNDGGYMLEAARRVANGQIPYRDFHFIYTPGSVLFLGTVFRLFSTSVLTERITMLIIGLIGSIFLILLMKDYKKGIVFPLIFSLVYGVWGPLHINFAIPTMFVLPTTFIFLYLIQRSIKTDNNTLYLASGLFAFLVFLFKQNFGLAILFVSFMTYILNKTKVKKIIYFATGFLLLFGVWMIFMYITGSLLPFRNDFLLFTWEKIFVEKQITTIFPSENPIKLLLYLSPLLINLWSLRILIFKKKSTYIAIPLMGILYYFIGIRPSTDYVHLTPLLALCGPSLYIIFRESIKTIKIIIFMAVIFSLTFGIYSGFFRNYYRWNSPLINQNQFYKNNKILIFTHPEIIHNLDRIIETINQNVEIKEPIFVYGDAPLIQYISNHETPINYISTSLFSKNDYDDMLYQIKFYSIKTIVVSETGDMSTVVGIYVQENYSPIATVSGVTIWSKK